MTDLAVRIENLSKAYKLTQSTTNRGQASFRETLTRGVRRPFARYQPDNEQELFWALKDVSLEIKRGEVVGIIGRNGAGKSTLLKILSRIARPTSGSVDLYGRIGSLLEVGTGFHPELTGRENVFLNGTILGMSRRDIRQRFDAIVDFAGVERFLDTPVKRYSSGMYVRLAFAVAAHLEPDILIIDEVLAVGDVEFQKKCLGKMNDFAESGRTVLFVSHNSAAVQQLCRRGIVLANGEVELDADAYTAVAHYLGNPPALAPSYVFPPDPSKEVQITFVTLAGADGQPTCVVHNNESWQISVGYHVTQWPTGAYVCIDVFDQLGQRLIWSSDVSNEAEMMAQRPAGDYEATVTIPGDLLAAGWYTITVAIPAPKSRTVFDARHNVLSLEIRDGGTFLAYLGVPQYSVLSVPMSWHTTQLD